MSILRTFSFTCTHAVCHRDAFNHTCFYRDIFTQRHLHTEMHLHRVAFTHTEMTFYIQILLQRDGFTLSKFTHRCQNKQGRFYKGMRSHEELLPINFAQTYYFLIFDGGHAYGVKEFSKHMQNQSFTRRISCERVGPAQTHIAIWPQCMTIDMSCKSVAFRGHQSMPPWRRKIKIVVVFTKLISACIFTSATLHLRVCTSRRLLEKIDLHLHLYIFRNAPAYIRLVAVLKKILEPASMHLHLNTCQ